MNNNNNIWLNYALNSVPAAIPLLNKTYVIPKHLKPVTDVLNAILRGEQKKLCISLPPRHGKTETLLAFIALYLNKYPEKNISYLSHTQTFAESKAIKSQTYCKTLGVKPDSRLNNRKEWRTDKGGGLFTSGIHGDIMGRGFNLVIVDDPISSRSEAESMTYRNKTWDCFEDGIETRLEPNASIIIVMTRWHNDDLIGRVLKNRNDYIFIRIPAICDDENDLLNRELGEALWSDRFDAKTLENMRLEKPYSFASMYQGLPQIKGSNLFKEPTFYERLPDSYKIRIGADLAYSDKQTSDYSTIVVTAENDGVFYIIHVERWQTEINESIRKLKSIQSKYNVPVILEANGPQKGIFDFVKKQLSVIKARVAGDKYVRALPVIEKWNAGRIRVPLKANWLDMYLEEVVNFTGVKDLHDDMVDATVYSIKEPINVHVNN